MGQGFQFLRSLYLCRELSEGVLRFCRKKSLQMIKDVPTVDFELEDIGNGEHFERVNNADVQVCFLVLEDIHSNEYQFLGEPTPNGREALNALQRIIFGPESVELGLMANLISGTYSQARLAARLCIAILVDAVEPSSCFTLLASADTCGCSILLKKAAKCALDNFVAAMDANYEGFIELSERQLTSLLMDDALIVSSELDVFKAISQWVEADLLERQCRFSDLMASGCLRFSELTIAEIGWILDESALVATDRRAMQLGAYALIQHHMGGDVVHDENLERSWKCQPRETHQLTQAMDEGSLVRLLLKPKLPSIQTQNLIGESDNQATCGVLGACSRQSRLGTFALGDMMSSPRKHFTDTEATDVPSTECVDTAIPEPAVRRSLF